MIAKTTSCPARPHRRKSRRSHRLRLRPYLGDPHTHSFASAAKYLIWAPPLRTGGQPLAYRTAARPAPPPTPYITHRYAAFPEVPWPAPHSPTSPIPQPPDS